MNSGFFLIIIISVDVTCEAPPVCAHTILMLCRIIFCTYYY
jgi:hypothetical protein